MKTGFTGRTLFSMRPKGSNNAAVIDRQGATVVTAQDTPQVRYDWEAADTATAGFFEAEFEVTYADGSIETFPNYGYIGVAISQDIA